MVHAEHVSRRLWSDWFFERVPLPPALFGALVTAALFALLALLGIETGELDRLAAKGVSWWQSRDGRIASLLAPLAGTIPAALRYHELALSVDRDPGLYFTARYWGPGQAFTWVVGSFVAFTGGILTYRVFSDARVFAQLGKREGVSLSDLLAWRAFVEAVPEWPIDVSTLSRFAVYVGIPVLGWIGAALVQHVLERALG